MKEYKTFTALFRIALSFLAIVLVLNVVDDEVMFARIVFFRTSTPLGVLVCLCRFEKEKLFSNIRFSGCLPVKVVHANDIW